MIRDSSRTKGSPEKPKSQRILERQFPEEASFGRTYFLEEVSGGFGRWCFLGWSPCSLSSHVFFHAMILPLFNKDIEFSHPPLESGLPWDLFRPIEFGGGGGR